MANEPQSGSPLLLILIIGAVIFSATRGGPTPEPVTPDPVKPDPTIVIPDNKLKPTPEQCWSELAKCVENKWIGGELQQHTDHIVKLADSLKLTGSIPDTSRVDQWRAKRIEITDSNRSEIAKQLRGK